MSNATENPVENNAQRRAADILPFNFGSQQVRTLLIGEQPWFVAADVSSALEYRIAGDMTRNLDEDEKGTQIVRTRGGDQEMLVINESGLYSAILRSRKAEAKHFKKWVTCEVLPSIRKYGSFTDHHGAMGDLVGAVIGTSGENVLDRVIDQKASPVPHSLQRSFKQTMKSRLRSRFNVHRTALIPSECLAEACNFVAAYALEGEWIGRLDTDGLFFSNQEVAHIYLLMSRHFCLMDDREAILASARTLDSRVLMRVFDQINEGRSSFAALDARRSEIYSIYRANGCSPGGYAIVA